MEQDFAEKVVMELVVNSGNARSIAMEAIEAAQDGKFEEAEQKISEARAEVNKAHNFQTDLMSRETSGDGVPFSVILCHGQDHLMTAMVVIDMAEKFIHLYKSIKA